MSVRVQLRRDTAANWASTNPTLTQGEPGYETDTGKIKYGDGTTAWNSLAYAAGEAFAAGSASAPSITFSADPNTGIYSPGADQLAISSNSVQRLLIDSLGNIGTNISSVPSYNANLRTISFNGTNGVVHDYAVGGTRTGSIVTQSGAVELSTQAAIPLIFSTNSAERMRLTSTGALGLGTSSPASTLHVAGTLRSTGQTFLGIGEATTLAYIGDPFTANTRSIIFNRPSGAVTGTVNIQGLNAGVGYTNISLQAQGGLVGIGSTSPGCELEIGGNGHIHLADQGRVGCNSGSGAPNDAYVKFYDSDIIGFHTTDTERARIDSSGRLLVGTSTAGAQLTVQSANATLSPIATLGVSGDTIYQSILVTKFDNNTTTSQNFIQFQVNNGGANCGRITANGANTAAFGSTSDIRLKENIENLPPQLEKILSLRPVEFDYIESEGGGHQIGFIAQEMQEIYPDVVNERGEDDMLMITGWSKTEARLVKALQEAVAKIETLEAEVQALKGA